MGESCLLENYRCFCLAEADGVWGPGFVLDAFICAIFLFISFSSQTLILLSAEYLLLSVLLTLQSHIYQTKSICCLKSAVFPCFCIC